MEKLHTMLRDYNLSHIQEQHFVPWAKQFTKHIFPKYWKVVYDILSQFDNSLKVIEIGCGLGDITAILCYLGFSDIISFEKDSKIATLAQEKMRDLFNRKNIIRNDNFPSTEMMQSDLLILVNCAYKDYAQSKQEYKDLMLDYYESAGCPKYFIMEVIDSSYTIPDEEFPLHIRLSRDDVKSIFPNSRIQEWKTYVYPVNSKSKTLYLITKI